MAQFDLPLDQLITYAPAIAEPTDFDAFWQRTLDDPVHGPLNARFDAINDADLPLVRVYDASFAGFGGQTIRAWMLEPAGNDRRLPCVVSYVGYGGGRSLPVAHLAPVAAGFAHFVMDTRGQGSSWSPGDTPDDHAADPQFPGFMTRGILSPDTYYYRRLIVDAVQAVEAAAAHPGVDPQRVAVRGASQGGGLAIAVAALAPRRVRLMAADVPFLCHFRRAIEITDAQPYAEIAAYLRCHRHRVAQALSTLAYFDGCSFAPRVRARCLFSVALMDLVCPPSTVFAAYNRVTAPKDIRVYPYNQHEGGDVFQTMEWLRLFRSNL